MLRLASAVVLIATVLTTIWLLPLWATVLLAAVAAAAAGAELAALAARAGATLPPAFVGVASAVVAVAFVLADSRATGAPGSALAPALLAVLVAGGAVALALGPPAPAALTRAAVMMMAPLYIGLPLGAILWVQCGPGRAATTWLLATIAVSDSAQYYTGRAFGRRKLAPTISPAKTVEGLVGGLIAAGLVGAFAGPRSLPGVSALVGAAIALTLAAFGVVGDLFESMLKRSVGAKDSSALIPGHGGVLDRIDSYLFAAPVFYLLARYLA